MPQQFPWIKLTIYLFRLSTLWTNFEHSFPFKSLKWFTFWLAQPELFDGQACVFGRRTTSVQPKIKQLTQSIISLCLSPCFSSSRNLFNFFLDFLYNLRKFLLQNYAIKVFTIMCSNRSREKRKKHTMSLCI